MPIIPLYYGFLEIFVGDKALVERDKIVMGDPPFPHYGKPWMPIIPTKLYAKYEVDTT